MENSNSIFDFDFSEDEEEEVEEISAPSLEERSLQKVQDPQTDGELLAALSQKQGVTIPKENMHILESFMQAAKYGHHAAMPMSCKGEACPVISMCPLKAAGATLPIDQKCPVESALIENWVRSYTTALEIDPDDPEHAIDMHMVYELAGLELVRTRAAHHMSSEEGIVTEKIVGYSPQGTPIYDDKPSMSLLIMERQTKLINKIRDQMLATRKSQAQVGQAPSDLSVRTANVMEKALQMMENRRKTGHSKVEEADFEVIDPKGKADEKPSNDSNNDWKDAQI